MVTVSGYEEYDVLGIYRSYKSAVGCWERLRQNLREEVQSMINYTTLHRLTESERDYHLQLLELERLTPRKTKHRYISRVPAIEKRELEP